MSQYDSNQLSGVRIVFVTTSLRCGGAERSIVTLAARAAESGACVTLVVCSSEETAFVPVPSSVPVKFVQTQKPKRTVGFWSVCLAFRLKRLISEEQPDAIVAFPDVAYIATLTLFFWSRVPIILSERVAPRFAPIPLWCRWLRKVVHRRADAIVVVASDIETEIAKPWHGRMYCIPGPIEGPIEVTLRKSSPDTFLVMGRLVHQKGIDVAIQAWSIIAEKLPNWTLTIVGSGPLRTELEQLCHRLDVVHRVNFREPVQEPYELIQSAEVFVLSSRFEGYPRVLAEAMMCGKAVIATACPGGSSTMVQDRINGLLVPTDNATALSDAMLELANDSNLRARLAKEAPHIRNTCGTDSACEKWFSVIRACLKEKQSSPSDS